MRCESPRSTVYYNKEMIVDDIEKPIHSSAIFHGQTWTEVDSSTFVIVQVLVLVVV